MMIVVDASIVIASIAKGAITRELLLFPFIKYYAPEFVFEEVEKYKKDIMVKANLDESDYTKTRNLIFGNISIVSKMNYDREMVRAAEAIGLIDRNDIPYVALALRLKAHGVWSYDKHFDKQKAIKALKTKDIASIIRSSEQL